MVPSGSSLKRTRPSVDTSRQRITIVQNNGNEFIYRLGDAFRIGDQDRSYVRPGYIQRGWDVELEIKDGRVYRLTRVR